MKELLEEQVRVQVRLESEMRRLTQEGSYAQQQEQLVKFRSAALPTARLARPWCRVPKNSLLSTTCPPEGESLCSQQRASPFGGPFTLRK